MMIASDGEVKQWDYDVVPGDVIVFPKSVEQEGRFTGRSRYIALTLSEEELAVYSTGERTLQDPQFWNRIHRLRPSPAVRAFISREVAERVAQLRIGLLPNSLAAIGFFRRTLLEAFITGILDAQGERGNDRQRQISSRIVRAVEDYVDCLSPNHPLHISELCSSLRVSRRTLHRAFQEALGHGPLDYLRLRRLANVRSRLMSKSSIQVTQAAFEAGFLDLARFGQYYRRIYREPPSETRRRTANSGRREQYSSD